MAFTFFFRDIHTLEQVAAKLLPEVEGKQKIKIWDAGCAMGPEPYTFLIVLAERMQKWMFNKVEMDASDIDESGNFGEIIEKGVYHYDTIKRMPEDIQKKYFIKYDNDKNYIIDNDIMRKIKFTLHDLTSLQPVSNNYSLVICKNVLLHLHPDMRVKVYEMFYSALGENGILVTEQTQEMPEQVKNKFNKITSDAQIFMKK